MGAGYGPDVGSGDDDGALISTGQLPRPQEVRLALAEAHERHRLVADGELADYIPMLATASPHRFGACIASTTGEVVEVGDSGHLFSIQSVSKPFVFALVCDALGHEEVRERIGVNGTGLAFDSVMAVELNVERTMNPMVNAGAIATTSLAPGSDQAERWQFVVDGLSRFAGRELEVDDQVYRCESETNLRNQGIAHLLAGYGRMYDDPDEATDTYTRQCSLLVSARDLAVMGATLADGGVNPVTGERVVHPDTCQRVLAVLATAGLYERSGDWLYDVGLPGKSGVSGGIVTVAPGKGGMGTYSPLLDQAGNSVRGVLLTTELSHRLGLNVFASRPEV